MNSRPENRKTKTTTSGTGNGETALLAYLPPQNLEYEKAILGVILVESSAFEIASDIIKKQCFYSQAHQIIWEVCEDIYRKGYKVDLLIVNDELNKKGLLEDIGGAYYLTELVLKTVNSAHLQQWCIAIFEKYQHREMINLCHATIVKSQDELDIFEVFEQHEQKLSMLMSGNTQTQIQKGMDVLMQVEAEQHSLENNERETIGLSTGFPQFNAMLSGFKGSNLILLAARPSIGKSAMSMNFALNVARENNVGIGIYTLEMSSKEYMYRMLSCVSEVPLERIMRGQMDEAERQRYMKARDELGKLKLFFDETPAINIAQLKSSIRRLVLAGVISIAILDYIQIMGIIQGMKFATRDLEIGFITSSLKQLSKELDIPIIALSQLSREIEKRAIKKPVLSDLRESGNIEQDADVVIFMHNPQDDSVDFTIAKNRNGKCDEFTLKFDRDIQKFFHRETWNEFKKPSIGFQSYYEPKVKDDGYDDLPF